MTCIAIVGAGPLATYAMSHLAALLPGARAVDRFHIRVFDRGGRFGAGDVHSDQQAQTSYLNRVAGQIAFAADESSRRATRLLPRALRPTFHEWYRARTDDPLRPTDVPPRYLHGVALREMFDRYVEILRGLPGGTVDLVRAEVTDVVPTGADPPFTVRVAAPGHPGYPAHQVLFVTGHSTNRPTGGDRSGRTRIVHDPYPLDERITTAVAPPGSVVGVHGLGLTAVDVVLHLTAGRGGRFTSRCDGSLRYVPSGREPAVIHAASPSGEVVCGRAVNQKLADPAAEHHAVFFTGTAIARLRALAPDGRLDFGRQLFPLVMLEMAYVYYRTLLGEAFAAGIVEAVAPRVARLLTGVGPYGEDGVRYLLEPPDALFTRELAEPTPEARNAFRRVCYGDPTIHSGPSPWGHPVDLAAHRFDWRAILRPVTARPPAPGAGWHRHLVEHLRRDVAWCAQGNLANPVKAACDGVWRDLRAEFCLAADDGGLRPDAQREFTNRYLRYYNRLSNGSGLVPLRRILALAEAGRLDLSVGPAPRIEPGPDGRLRLVGSRSGVGHGLDTLVRARVHPFRPHTDVAPLYRNLLRSGLVRQWRNRGGPGEADLVPGGLDLDEGYHPVAADGSVDRRLTFLGAPAEGLRHFQLSAARPHADSYVLDNVVRWAEELVARAWVGAGR